MKAYTEAIKRDPQDPRGYNNRANAYTKLAALPEALKDADEAIKVDPKFVKAYIRKSHVLYTMRDYLKAIEVVEQAADIDEEKKHTREIGEMVAKCQQALMSQRQGETEEETLQRAMRDPEIAVCAAYSVLCCWGGRTDILFAENHERPDHAVNLATGAGEPRGAAGPHEEPGCAAEYHEAHQRGHYQDGAVVSLVRWFSCFSRSDCFVWKSSIPLYLYSSLWAHVIQVSFAHHYLSVILNSSTFGCTTFLYMGSVRMNNRASRIR